MSEIEEFAMRYAVAERKVYWDVGVTCVDTENYYPDIINAVKAGVDFVLAKAKELANAPDNGMALEESAFVEQLEELLKKAA